MKILIPETFMGVPVKGAMERVLAKASVTQPVKQTQTNAPSKDGFIYIPEPNIYFAKERTHLNKNWNETHDLLKSEGLRMPTMEEFRKTLAYLKTSNEQELYKEITEVRTPWRSEWIDAYFEKRKDGLYLLTENKTKAERLEDCLMKDKTPGINLDNWLEGKNTTSQGLPKSNMEKDDLYYWYPKDKQVARFGASSVGAGLICGRYSDDAGSDLGVFAVMEVK